MSGGIQLSYSHGTSATALLGETIGANLRRVAAMFGGNEAVVDVPTGRRWSYRQFDADTDALACGLRQSGVRLLVSAETFKTSDYRAIIDEVRDDLAELERVIYIGTQEWDGLLAAGSRAEGPVAAGSGDALAQREESLAFDDAINIQYTSGT